MNWREAKWLGRPWQDLAFSLGEIVFLVALIPLLWTNAHIPAYTGLSTGAMLLVFCVCQVSYRNWITFCLTATAAILWIALGLGLHLQ